MYMLALLSFSIMATYTCIQVGIIRLIGFYHFTKFHALYLLRVFIAVLQELHCLLQSLP